MLSTTHRFLFIHIPKTGGNSIQNVLAAYSDDYLVRTAVHHDGTERFEVRSTRYKTIKHSTLREYEREYDSSLFGGLRTVCCVRNPWERCISHFFSPHRGPVEWSPEAFATFVCTNVKPLRHYLAISQLKNAPFQDCIERISYVMRFERLQADFENACNEIGIPAVELPRRNVSTRQDYRSYYDSSLTNLVHEKFSEEIEYFRYSLDDTGASHPSVTQTAATATPAPA